MFSDTQGLSNLSNLSHPPQKPSLALACRWGFLSPIFDLRSKPIPSAADLREPCGTSFDKRREAPAPSPAVGFVLATNHVAEEEAKLGVGEVPVPLVVGLGIFDQILSKRTTWVL